MTQRYLLALGSNTRHFRFGRPELVVAAAIVALEREAIDVLAVGAIIGSAPLGPSLRRYANSAIVVETELGPEALLGLVKRIERAFGRRRGGRRWSRRVLDIDLILWSGGTWATPGLTIPHTEFRHRDFVLRPALAIAGAWRDPLSGRSLRQLAALLGKPMPRP